MLLNQNKRMCCGCEACSAVCSHNAIKMLEDNEGFVYPVINEELCVSCGACIQICSFHHAKESKTRFFNKLRHTYAVKHLNLNIRLNSRSGGVFTALSDYVLSQKGVIYGASLVERNVVIHIRATDAYERDAIRGSKYVQSKTNSDMYYQIKKDLSNGRPVLFTGTSCQVAAVQALFSKKSKKLFCVDIVCHGVPSPKILRDYVDFWEEKMDTKLTSIDFRNKIRYGWSSHVERLYFGNKHVDSCIFTQLFYQHNILRPSCYSCPYKCLEHPGDITIADYWGIEKACPGFSDNKGVSLVLVNTDKGEELFDNIKSDVCWKETEIEKSMQPTLVAPFEAPQNRKTFWADYHAKGFEYIVQKYASDAWKIRIKYILKQILIDLKLYK